MKIVGNAYYQEGPQRPQPPKRTAFVKEGTIAENDGKFWILVRQYAGMGDSYKAWMSYDSWKAATS